MGIPKERHTSDDSKPTTKNEKKTKRVYEGGRMVKEYKKSWMDLAKAKDINIYNSQ